MIGFLIVDKEPGWTSHDVVARVRRITGERRVGHAGTLDPGATGVLVVAVGPATRLLRFLSGADKEYRGEVVLGTTTTTLDDEGEVTGTYDMGAVTLEAARVAATRLTGTIEQRVPMVSAVKVGGKRLHRLAREGIQVDTPVRSVTIKRFEVIEATSSGTFSIEVTCSAGTYIRALAADLGTLLGGGAHLRALRRTRSGECLEADARTLGWLESGWAERGPAVLVPPNAVLGLEAITVDAAVAGDVVHGRTVSRTAVNHVGVGPYALVDPTGSLIAVYELDIANDALRPTVVLPSG